MESRAHRKFHWLACVRASLLFVSLLFFALQVDAQCVSGAPYPDSDPCFQQVIAADPFCCNSTWDGLCQSSYDACIPAGGGGSGCTVTLNMQDSFGDGWNGAFISVSYNGVFQANYTAVGFGSTATFTVPQGVVVTFSYSPGTWDEEVSYTIAVNGNIQYAAGPFPPVGVVFTYTCPADPGGGGDPGGGDGGACAPGVGGSAYAGTGSIVITPIGQSSGGGSPIAAGQCLGGGCAVGIPWGAVQTTVSMNFVPSVDGTWPGEYNLYNVTAGEQYEWSLCPEDGALVGIVDSQLTLKDSFGNNLCYSDDQCGLHAKIAWTATFTGEVWVQVNQFNCATAASSTTVVWRCVSCGDPVVDPGTDAVIATPAQLITDVFLGDCLTAGTVQFSGNPLSIGSFSNGWGIGIESGIILTTGLATDAMGPNVSPSTSYPSGGGSSPLLGGNTNDQSTFTFTFVPETEQVTFTYVFASEEYPEYVCSTFNDAFGFFVSGPGYAPNTNIAIVPGSTLPVAINTVNPGVTGAFGAVGGCTSLGYAGYYVDNTGGTHNEYDGFTVPLTACINTVPCEEYTITITVADVGDTSFDSAVFLEAESFSAGTSIDIVATVDQDLANVSSGLNCDDNGFFVFQLNEPYTEPITLVYNVDVSGAANVDPVPLSVTFQPGETSVAVPVSADAVGTSLTLVTLTMSSADNPGVGCTCEVTETTSTLYLCDLLLLLPVTWLSFEAKNINDDREVLCDWLTASEQNNDFFTVERSADQQVWVELGSVPGAGNSSEVKSYQYIDRSPLPNVSYYRVRQTDFNGETSYSEVRAVTRKAETQLAVYPNPGNGVYTLVGYHNGDLSVFDVSGRRIPFTLSMQGELDLLNAAPGWYVIELLKDEGVVERIRVIRQ